ncbi:hypothetical protein [Corynebacterium striatum]|uniref:hypothetical protein n=1 Tax=Corynebacterium striatum TaxID=43770 RepID=UPI0012FA15D7|nr:hypothetical protein [Corynebacterium striatum]
MAETAKTAKTTKTEPKKKPTPPVVYLEDADGNKVMVAPGSRAYKELKKVQEQKEKEK